VLVCVSFALACLRAAGRMVRCPSSWGEALLVYLKPAQKIDPLDAYVSLALSPCARDSMERTVKSVLNANDRGAVLFHMLIRRGFPVQCTCVGAFNVPYSR
jgi:hypothetical protein